MAFALALLRTRLDLFHGEMDGDGRVGSQEGNPLNFASAINHTREPQTPVQVSGKEFLLDTARTHFLLMTEGPKKDH